MDKRFAWSIENKGGPCRVRQISVKAIFHPRRDGCLSNLRSNDHFETALLKAIRIGNVGSFKRISSVCLYISDGVLIGAAIGLLIDDSCAPSQFEIDLCTSCIGTYVYRCSGRYNDAIRCWSGSIQFKFSNIKKVIIGFAFSIPLVASILGFS